MDEPRIFLGSSGKPEKLLRGLTRRLEEVADVEPWTTSFNPGTTTLERLVELAHEVDFAVFVFAQDDWTTASPPAPSPSGSGQASPRDNVVFEAGLFGGVLGMRQTFILHSSGAKLPSDLLGLTSVSYGDAATPSELRVINEKLRKAIEHEGRLARIEGLWWQFSLTEIEPGQPSAVSLLRVSRHRNGALEIVWPLMAGGWPAVGEILVRSVKGTAGSFGHLLLLEWGTAPGSERTAAGGHRRNPAGVRRSRVRILYDSFRCALGHEVSDGRLYWRADPGDMSILDGGDNRQRAELIGERLRRWKAMTNA